MNVTIYEVVDVRSGARDLVCSDDCTDVAWSVIAPVSSSDIADTVVGTCAGCGRVLIDNGVLVVQ